MIPASKRSLGLLQASGGRWLLRSTAEGLASRVPFRRHQIRNPVPYLRRRQRIIGFPRLERVMRMDILLTPVELIRERSPFRNSIRLVRLIARMCRLNWPIDTNAGQLTWTQSACHDETRPGTVATQGQASRLTFMGAIATPPTLPQRPQRTGCQPRARLPDPLDLMPSTIELCLIAIRCVSSGRAREK